MLLPALSGVLACIVALVGYVLVLAVNAVAVVLIFAFAVIAAVVIVGASFAEERMRRSGRSIERGKQRKSY